MSLNPRHAKKLGFYSLFAYANQLGKVHQQPVTFALNEIGVPDTDQAKNLLSVGLKTLGYQGNLWSDQQIDGSTLTYFIDSLLHSSWLKETDGAIKHCKCMKVQYIEQATLRKTKTSLTDPNGFARCCNSQIQATEVRVLLTAPLEPPVSHPKLYPIWAKKEFDWIYSELKGQQLLFSRINDRHFFVTTKSNNTFWIDNDVIGMLLVGLLNKEGVNVEHVISGVSTMRQAALMTLISQALGVKIPEYFHFLPRVDVTEVSLTSENALQSLVEKFGVNRVTNALLWCASSGRQNISLEKNLFSRMLDREPELFPDLSKMRRSLLVS